eukprot:6481735-Amphidinium_carterae.1
MCSRRLCLTHRGAAIAQAIPGKANLYSFVPDVSAVSTHISLQACLWLTFGSRSFSSRGLRLGSLRFSPG